MRVISRALSRNSIFKRTFCSMFLMILVPKVTGAAEFSAVLKPEHESFTWRRIANRTEPTLNKTFHWIRHEQIGIGNTLGGYVTSMISALREDRLLVITSRILFKFCDVVKCSVEPLMAPYKKKVGANVSIGSAYYFKVGYAANELNGIRDIINAVGCAFQQPIIANRQVPGKKRYLNVDYDWPKRCLYSKIVRSLVESGDGMLQKRKEWLRTFFVGDRYRFDFVISIVKDNILPVYDYVLHLRTIALIEDMTTEDGLPANLKEKSDAFVASAAFENMVQCFAAEIAKGSVQKSKISRSTMKSGWLQADRTVNIYVTTDCAQIRAEFAERIKSAVVVRLASNHDGPKMLQKLSPLSFIGNSTQEHRLVPPLVEVSDWKVAVDYFNGNLSAAHFFVWTMPNKEMKESDWGEIIGTVGDWLFMGQGQTMLTVKGTKGGERALPSSFAMSAAGFGVTEYVKSLRGSAAGKCDQIETGGFMRPMHV